MASSTSAIADGTGIRTGESHALLLRAAAADRDSAIEAWQAWQAQTSIGAVDHPSLRLLPRIHGRLSRWDTDPGAQASELASVQRLSWTRCQLLIGAAAGIVVAWERAGIPSVVLKGGALNAGQTLPVGERWYGDIDLLVHPEQAADAHRVLLEQDWRAHDLPPADLMSIQHASAYDNGRGQSIDLHWRSQWLPAREDELWDAARPGRLGGADVLVPDPADLLVQASVHGATWFPDTQLDWLADVAILARAEGLDWDRVAAEATRRRAVPWVAAALGYVGRELDVIVPPATAAALEAGLTDRDRGLYTEVGRPHSFRRTIRIAREVHRRYGELGVPEPHEPSLWSFMRATMRHDDNLSLASHGFRRAWESALEALQRRRGGSAAA